MKHVWMIGLLIFWIPTICSAAPDTTMTITPTATSGSTITASDENSRNNAITTAYNSHSHTDLAATTANTYTVGNNASGSKAFAVDNQFTTSPSIRYVDTTERWQFSNNASTFIDFANLGTVTTTIGAGTAANQSLVASTSFTTSPAIRYNYVAEGWQFSNNATTFQNFFFGYKQGSFTRDMTAASGNQVISGLGNFIPRFCVFVAVVGSTARASWGVDDTSTGGNVTDDAGGTADTYTGDTTNSINLRESSAANQVGKITATASGQFTFAWTKAGSPSAGTATISYVCGG